MNRFYFAITLILTVTLPLMLVIESESAEVEYLITSSTDYSVNPVSGSSYHLTRQVDQFGNLVGGSWNPQRPPTHAYYTAVIFATGLGKIEFTFSEGASHTQQVGDWGMKLLGTWLWYQTEENKRVSWFQKVVFPCYRVKPGHSPADPNAEVDTSKIYPGTYEKNVTSTIVPKPAMVSGDIPTSFQLSLSKTPVSFRFGFVQWRMGSRTPITKQIDATWTVTYSDTKVTTCAHENCTKIVPSAGYHYTICAKQGTPKGCGDPYWTCQPEASRHKPWPCIACGVDFKPCTPNGHEVWVTGPCPASLIVNGATVPCNADPYGYYECVHTHNFPGSSYNQNNNGNGSGSDNTPDCSDCTSGCSSCQ